MKGFFIVAALLSVAVANPVALPEVGVGKCFCEPPTCPMELIAECKCKNAAALQCYEDYLAKGINCPKPTPTPCGTLLTDRAPLTPTGPRCGGFLGTPCPTGYKCIDDITDTCDPKKGGADCIGVCVKTSKTTDITCGGLLGLPCPKGYTCVDDPSDTCDPTQGGSDCIGVCEVNNVLSI